MNSNRAKTSVTGLIRRAAVTVAIAGFVLVPQAPTLAQPPSTVGCGSVISVPGHYALVADETCAGDGITIAASGVRLDLAGFTLTGPGVANTAGVRADGVSAVRISGGGIVAFLDGINMSNVSNLRVTDVRATGNLKDGMTFSNLDASTIVGCVASNNFGGGIDIRDDSDDNEIKGNTASFNVDGVGFAGFSNERNRVVGNTVTGNSDDGIDLANSLDSLAQGNTALGNAYGIFVGASATNATIRGNVVSSSVFHGIAVSAQGAVIQGNFVEGSGLADMRDINLPSCLNV